MCGFKRWTLRCGTLSSMSCCNLLLFYVPTVQVQQWISLISVALWNTRAVNLTSKKKKKISKENKYIIRSLGWCMCRDAKWIQIPSTHCGGYGGEVVSGCPPQHQPSSLSLMISSLLPSPPPSTSSFHFPKLVMSLAASDVKVSLAEGTMELRENVRASTRVSVHVSACFLCMCVCVSLLTGY